jgi:DNA-binding NarL/FixJ family response regulator
MSEISIVIADDHPIVRQGLRQAIAVDPQFKILAEAGNGEEALLFILDLKPKIALLDMDMPKLSGMDIARQIVKQRLPVEIVYLTIHGEEDLFHAAMDIGAKGYILKESASLEIVQGLRAVAGGQYFVTPSLSAYLLRRRHRGKQLEESHPNLAKLSPTERHVLQSIALDKSSKEIAAELFIHYRTVENHRTNICHKLGIHGPHALFKFALKHRTEL